jgi:hypothetical protein
MIIFIRNAQRALGRERGGTKIFKIQIINLERFQIVMGPIKQSPDIPSEIHQQTKNANRR